MTPVTRDQGDTARALLTPHPVLCPLSRLAAGLTFPSHRDQALSPAPRPQHCSTSTHGNTITVAMFSCSPNIMYIVMVSSVFDLFEAPTPA